MYVEVADGLWNHLYYVVLFWEILEHVNTATVLFTGKALVTSETIRSITSSASVSLRRPWLSMQLGCDERWGRIDEFFF